MEKDRNGYIAFGWSAQSFGGLVEMIDVVTASPEAGGGGGIDKAR